MELASTMSSCTMIMTTVKTRTVYLMAAIMKWLTEGSVFFFSSHFVRCCRTFFRTFDTMR